MKADKPQGKHFVFVYSLDAGVGNLVKDIAHKAVSPETYPCTLCGLTYGLFSEHKEWREFVKTLPYESAFLHRDEFHERYPGQSNAELPAVFIDDGTGSLQVAISKEEIDRAEDLEGLMQLVTERLMKQ